VNTGGDRNDTLNAIRQSMEAAVNARRKVLDAEVDSITLDPAKPIPYADVAIKSGRYSAAISALSPIFTTDNRRIDIGDRLAFAQMRSLRLTAARTTVNAMIKFGKPDAYTFALQAVLAHEAGDTRTADDAISKALLNDVSNVGVQTAQAYIALRRNKGQALGPLAQNLAKEEGQRRKSTTSSALSTTAPATTPAAANSSSELSSPSRRTPTCTWSKQTKRSTSQ